MMRRARYQRGSLRLRGAVTGLKFGNTDGEKFKPTELENGER